MEHIRALEKFLENADVEEVKFIRVQLKKLWVNFDRKINGENVWKTWSRKEEEDLIRLKNSGLDFNVIATELKRTGYSVKLRYEKIMSRDTQKQNSSSTTE